MEDTLIADPDIQTELEHELPRSQQLIDAALRTQREIDERIEQGKHLKEQAIAALRQEANDAAQFFAEQLAELEERKGREVGRISMQLKELGATRNPEGRRPGRPAGAKNKPVVAKETLTPVAVKKRKRKIGKRNKKEEGNAKTD